MNNLKTFEEFKIPFKKIYNNIKEFFKDECPECLSKEVNDDYFPKSGIHEMTCKKCGHKWKRLSNEAGW